MRSFSLYFIIQLPLQLANFDRKNDNGEMDLKQLLILFTRISNMNIRFYQFVIVHNHPNFTCFT